MEFQSTDWTYRDYAAAGEMARIVMPPDVPGRSRFVTFISVGYVGKKIDDQAGVLKVYRNGEEIISMAVDATKFYPYTHPLRLVQGAEYIFELSPGTPSHEAYMSIGGFNRG